MDARRRLERLYEEQRVKLWRALVGFSGDPEVASDAVAEAFAQAFARPDAIARPDAWVWRAAFRIAARELGRRRREGPGTVERPLDQPEPLHDLLRALSRISPNQRLAVILHDYADRPVAEVAGTMGISRATVHVHLSQGRRRLRAMLETHDE